MASTAVTARKSQQRDLGGGYENADDAADDGDGAVTAVVHRRTKGRQSLKRLSDIMSAYIPVSPGYRPDRRPLLESHLENDDPGAAAAQPDGSGGGGQRAAARGSHLIKLLDVSSLSSVSSDEEQQLDEDPRLADLAGRDLANVAVSASGFVFLAFSDSPCILRLQLTRPDAQPTMASTTTMLARSCRVLEVTVRGGARLSPIADLKVHGDRLYVSGCVDRRGGAGAEHRRVCVVARCDLDGRTQLVSKELPYPKFLGFDLDGDSGEPVVASVGGNGSGSREAQVFKMSGDFKRKLFKIQLGSRATAYRPEFVACLPRANACWVATEQSVAGQPLRHRLLSFPLRCPAPTPDGGQAPPTKSWLKVSSWKLDRVRPGRLLAVPGSPNRPERLLMLSREQGNILCLNGEDQLACTAFTHPLSDGGPFFTSLCCCPSAGDASGHREDEIGILATTRDSLYLLQAAWV